MLILALLFIKASANHSDPQKCYRNVDFSLKFPLQTTPNDVYFVGCRPLCMDKVKELLTHKDTTRFTLCQYGEDSVCVDVFPTSPQWREQKMGDDPLHLTCDCKGTITIARLITSNPPSVFCLPDSIALRWCTKAWKLVPDEEKEANGPPIVSIGPTDNLPHHVCEQMWDNCKDSTPSKSGVARAI